MSYVFDTNAFSALFKSYYRKRFPSLWAEFDHLIATGEIVSTREVLRELEGYSNDELNNWCKNNGTVFSTPTAVEGAFVAKIYRVQHFQQNIERTKLLKGGNNADPFVIAKAASMAGSVVTLEKPKPNAVKVPNICIHFGISCMSLEEFMEAESWSF
ncbi:MAG: PIN domain-containing protein [Henriciella sp.]